MVMYALCASATWYSVRMLDVTWRPGAPTAPISERVCLCAAWQANNCHAN